jgi:hypothetical protein
VLPLDEGQSTCWKLFNLIRIISPFK